MDKNGKRWCHESFDARHDHSITVRHCEARLGCIEGFFIERIKLIYVSFQLLNG